MGSDIFHVFKLGDLLAVWGTTRSHPIMEEKSIEQKLMARVIGTYSERTILLFGIGGPYIHQDLLLQVQ